MGPPPVVGVLQEGGSPLEESKDDILGLIEASTNRDIEKAMCWAKVERLKEEQRQREFQEQANTIAALQAQLAVQLGLQQEATLAARQAQEETAREKAKNAQLELALQMLSTSAAGTAEPLLSRVETKTVAVQTTLSGACVSLDPKSQVGRARVPFNTLKVYSETWRENTRSALEKLRAVMGLGSAADVSACLVAMSHQQKKNDPQLPPKMAGMIGTVAVSGGRASKAAQWTWVEIEDFMLKTAASKQQITKLKEKGITCSYKVWHRGILEMFMTENPPLHLLRGEGAVSAFRVDLEAAWKQYVDHPEYSKYFLALHEGFKTLLIAHGDDGTNENGTTSLYLSCSRAPQLIQPNGSPASLSAKLAIVNVCGRFGEKKDVIHHLFADFAEQLNNFTVLHSELFGDLDVAHCDVGDLKNLLIHLCLTHSAGSWPCISCTCPKSELGLRHHVAADMAQSKCEHRPRHMKDLGCTHEISKNTAKKVHCACLIPAADYLKAKFPVGGPTHRQDHPEHKQIVAEAKARTYGCVGYPLYPAIPVMLVVYGVYHMCQNIKTVLATMLVHAAINLQAEDKLQELVACEHPGPNLPHWSVVQAAGTNWKKGFDMDVQLTPEEVALVDKKREKEVKDASDIKKKGLTGGEMKRLIGALPWVLKALEERGEDGKLSGRSRSVREIIAKSFALWRDAEEVILATTWDHNRSEEARTKIHAWCDYIKSANIHRFMLGAEIYLKCTPVHEAVNHFADKANHFYEMYGIALGSLTDQAIEQLNQWIMGLLRGGRGAIVSPHVRVECCEDGTVLQTGKVVKTEHGQLVFSDTKFWCTMHRHHRLLFQHHALDFASSPFEYKNCRVCKQNGIVGTHRADQAVCPFNNKNDDYLEATALLKALPAKDQAEFALEGPEEEAMDFELACD